MVQHLATPETVERLVRRLREGGSEPDVGVGVWFLSLLGSAGVAPVCEVYDQLNTDETMRRLLATFLVEHVNDQASLLTPLTLSQPPHHR